MPLPPGIGLPEPLLIRKKGAHCLDGESRIASVNLGIHPWCVAH